MICGAMDCFKISSVAMTKVNYAICLSVIIHHEKEAEHLGCQTITPSSWNISVWPSIPCHQFIVYSSEIFTTYISPASLRYAKMRNTLSVFVHHAVVHHVNIYSVTSASSSELLAVGIRLHFQWVCITAVVLLTRALTVNAAAAVGNLQIMLVVWRIITR